MEWFGIVSYGTAALVYGATTAVLFASRPDGRSARYVLFATGVSTLWAACMALFLMQPVPVPIVIAMDALLALSWTACTLSWFGRSPGRISLNGFLLAASVAFGSWGVIASMAAEFRAVGQSVSLALLGSGLVGLLAVEQLFRNAPETQRERLRLRCLGVGGVFVLNVFVYSQASLLEGALPIFWEGRGLASAALAPVILIALKGMSGWERELFVSRQVVFYSASLVAVGGYLLAMGAVGYVIFAFGGQWSFLLQSLFLVAALAILVFVLFSAKIRSHAKVLLIKHFYRNKYDYREEWLGLTAMLGRGGDSRTLARNALDGIARIVGIEAGSLWLTTDGRRYEWIASLERGAGPGETYADSHPLVRFLATSGWVVDTEQYRLDPNHYGAAFGDPLLNPLPNDSLIVPLDRQGFLQGFVVLPRPVGAADLNFEDHDILKTAGRQVAVVLAQALAQEQLAATRQFEAMNKLSTFLMHDLKNVVAQQELIVANAQKFKHRPDFIDDAVRTMEAGAQRMRNILNRLENAGRTLHTERADIVRLLKDACDQCADRRPVPQFSSSVEAYRADIDRDRIAMAITHAIRNAQDATRPDGRIEVSLDVRGTSLSIEVSDTGAGMTSEFIRERLFKPFDSTKGAKGMGIGAYQIRETFRAAGGEVEIDSEPGQGTRVRMTLAVARENVAERSVA